ncbi:hypothetical protein P9B58_02800 [Bacillus mojavensis]|uniref:DUF6773 family protein n=1 Tax=Bacillus mojavensis TaxID=72360 RepID=UPI002DBF89B0|nr:DUF6773 family protein [Bacillus mojavensis]MEC1289204.1 hypothetical protein [Bacillus mojavensis]MEC1635218.1 hypothetical protein [Bacillus mojavensis]MEC1705518.1 hypothetical protein [Bacillus mojavensis]MEC5245432.1 hypothetical protein [Bacillus mojavensis]
MNNLHNRLSGVNGKNKRVKEKEQKIWSEIGMLAGAFALLDVIIRGIMFEFPFKEWVASLVFLFIIILYYCIRASASGMLMPRIDTEKDLHKRVKQQFIESIAVGFAVVVLTMYDRGIPHTFFAWLKMFLLFIVCGGVLFLLRFGIVKLSYRRSVKREFKKKSS